MEMLRVAVDLLFLFELIKSEMKILLHCDKFFDEQIGAFMIDYSSVFGYTPNITFTLEQHLKNYSEIEVNARRLLESFHIIREKMEVNLRPVIALFPHYSEHSHEHSEHIISAIEKLLGRDRIEKLLPADTWMLLVCAYMHDLGMLVQGKELELDWQTTEFQDHIHNCMRCYERVRPR